MAGEAGGGASGIEPPLSAPLPAPPLPPWPTVSSSAVPVGAVNVVTGRRIVAGLLDLVPLAFLAVAMGDRTAEAGRFNVSLGGTKLIWWLLAAIAYYAVAEVATRTSPGKAVMGLCVRNDRAQRASTGQILKRSALRIVDILPALYLVGVVTIAASTQRKRVGDMVAGTQVLQRSDIGEPKPGGRTILALLALVAITLGLSVGLLATADSADSGQQIGAFDLNDDVIPYADRLIADALQPPSFESLRQHLTPGIVSDDDLQTFVSTFTGSTGGMTDDYHVVDQRRDTYTLPSGTRAEAITLRIDAQFVTRPGQLDLVIADVDGELRLIGFQFRA